jgi:hypothetical protein
MAKLSKEQWSEVLTKVKEGEKISDLAKLYGVSTNSIYNKTSSLANKDSSLLEINRLKREVKTLREVLGYVTTELSKEKKLV